MAPARKFSATTSKCGAMSSTSWRPSGILQVDADAALAEVVAQEGGTHGAAFGVGHRRAGSSGPSSPPGGSILTTSAPSRASSWVANGSACICSSARMRMPCRGPDGRRSEGSAATSTICIWYLIRGSSPRGRAQYVGAGKRGAARWPERYDSRSTAPSRPSPTTTRRSTTRSTTTWTRSSSTSWPSCAPRPTCGPSSGAGSASPSPRGATSGRIGGADAGMTHHELMRRGHRGIRAIFDLDAPIIVALQGWAIGGLVPACAAVRHPRGGQGARFMLPEVGHGVIPDTGGVGRIFQMCGHGVAADMVLTGRVMSAEEALGHGVVSRRRGARARSTTRSARWPRRSPPRRR